MKRKRSSRILTALLILVFALSVLAGCGAKIAPLPNAEATATAEPLQTSGPSPVPTSAPSPSSAPTPTAEPSPEPTPEQTPEPTPEPTPDLSSSGESEDKPDPITNADGSVTVFTVKQLLETIAPGMIVELAEGVYNISDFYGTPGSDAYHDYWYFDWGTLTLWDLSDLTIRARAGDRVELVTEDCYADVLKLMSCENVRLEGLIMGHAVEPGHCIGGVVELSYCEGILLQDLDLYGCGTYGVIADHSSGVYTGGTVIRECSYGIMDLHLCTGFVFSGCTMRDCVGYEQLQLDHSVVEFQSCSFTGNQSSYGFLPQYNTNDILFSYCSFDSWEREQLEKQAPKLSRVTFALDEDQPCSYQLYRPTSLEELIEDIRPNARIDLWEMYGTYDLSAFLEKVWADEGEDWNARHHYVQIRECYDGLDLVIRNCDGLSIVNPKGPSSLEFTVDPRYATVLSFSDCDDLTLRGLTLGHTQYGECWGNVLDFTDCQRVVLRELDVYGCGFFGLTLESGCEDFTVCDSVIRDCSAGPLSIENCGYNITFMDCVITGSVGGGYYWRDGDYDTVAYFLRCTFGSAESAELFYRNNVQTERCQWSEDLWEYPDDEDDYPYDPASAVSIPFSSDTLTSFYWVGWSYAEKDGDDEALLLPCYDEEGYALQYYLSFTEEGTGLLETLMDGEVRELPLTWVCAANYSADLFTDDTGIAQGTVALYFEEHDDDDGYHSRYWLKMNLYGDLYWFY